MTLLLILFLQVSSVQDHADIRWQAFQIEQLQRDIQDIQTKLNADAQQNTDIAVLKSQIAELPTNGDIYELLLKIGLIGGGLGVAGKGGHVLYKKRRNGDG